MEDLFFNTLAGDTATDLYDKASQSNEAKYQSIVTGLNEYGKQGSELVKLSKTLSDLGDKVFEKEKEKAIARGITKHYTEGFSQDSIDAYNAEKTRQTGIKSYVDKKANTAMKNGASFDISQKVKGMSGWEAYGYAKAYVSSKSQGYSSWLDGQLATNNSLQITVPDPTSPTGVKEITPATAKGPAERAAVMAELREQYWIDNGLTNINPLILNEVGFATYKEADARLKAKYDKRDRVQASLKYQEDTLNDASISIEKNIDQYNLLDTVNALSGTVDKNDNHVDLSGSWDLTKKHLIQRAADGKLTEAQLDQIFSAQLRPGDKGYKSGKARTIKDEYGTTYDYLLDQVREKNNTNFYQEQRAKDNVSKQTELDEIKKYRDNKLEHENNPEVTLYTAKDALEARAKIKENNPGYATTLLDNWITNESPSAIARQDQLNEIDYRYARQDSRLLQDIKNGKYNRLTNDDMDKWEKRIEARDKRRENQSYKDLRSSLEADIKTANNISPDSTAQLSSTLTQQLLHLQKYYDKRYESYIGQDFEPSDAAFRASQDTKTYYNDNGADGNNTNGIFYMDRQTLNDGRTKAGGHSKWDAHMLWSSDPHGVRAQREADIHTILKDQGRDELLDGTNDAFFTKEDVEAWDKLNRYQRDTRVTHYAHQLGITEKELMDRQRKAYDSEAEIEESETENTINEKANQSELKSHLNNPTTNTSARLLHSVNKDNFEPVTVPLGAGEDVMMLAQDSNTHPGGIAALAEVVVGNWEDVTPDDLADAAEICSLVGNADCNALLALMPDTIDKKALVKAGIKYGIPGALNSPYALRTTIG